jgi:hypothetical protein
MICSGWRRSARHAERATLEIAGALEVLPCQPATIVAELDHGMLLPLQISVSSAAINEAIVLQRTAAIVLGAPGSYGFGSAYPFDATSCALDAGAVQVTDSPYQA